MKKAQLQEKALAKGLKTTDDDGNELTVEQLKELLKQHKDKPVKWGLVKVKYLKDHGSYKEGQVQKDMHSTTANALEKAGVLEIV